MEIYEKFMGDDPRKVPMKIFPAVHYSMGGLWVDYDQMTNIPGLFAAGEADYSIHGANRLGANSLLSSIFGGMVAGPKAAEYIDGLDQLAEEMDSRVFDAQVQKDQDEFNKILKMNGKENAFKLHEELGSLMTENVTVVRENERLAKTDEAIVSLLERYQDISIDDTSQWSNQSAAFIRQLKAMMNLARVVTVGALNRNESRGAHYKPEFPDRNDEEWLKTTKAKFNPETQDPEFEYEDVDVSLIEPRKRDYTSKKKAGEKA